MICSENRFPPRIESGAGFFGIMLERPDEMGLNRLSFRSSPRKEAGTQSLAEYSALDTRILRTHARLLRIRRLRAKAHAGLMLAERITLPHFSVSSATSLPKSA